MHYSFVRTPFCPENVRIDIEHSSGAAGLKVASRTTIYISSRHDYSTARAAPRYFARCSAPRPPRRRVPHGLPSPCRALRQRPDPATPSAGPASTEKREQSLAAQMAEQAAMGVGDAEAMALRKARAKVALRSAMDNQLHRVAPGLFIGEALCRLPAAPPPSPLQHTPQPS